MVSVRRVKYVIKLSIVALIVLSVILFHQWEDLSYNERVRRFVRGRFKVVSCSSR